MKGGGGGGGRISVLCSGTGTVDTTNVPRMHAFGGRGFDDDFAEESFGAQKRLYHGGGSGGSAGDCLPQLSQQRHRLDQLSLAGQQPPAASHPTFVVDKDLVEFEFATVQLIRGGEFAVSPEGISNVSVSTTQIKRLLGDKTGRLHVIRNSNIIVSGNNMTSTRVGQSTFSDEVSSRAWRTTTTRTYYLNDLLNAEYHMKVYQGGNLVLPGRVTLSGCVHGPSRQPDWSEPSCGWEQVHSGL